MVRHAISFVTFFALMSSISAAADVYQNGVLLGRSASNYDKEDIEAFNRRHDTFSEGNPYFDISTGNQPAAQIILQEIKNLAEKSKLTDYLTNSKPIEIQIIRDEDENTPDVSFYSGVVMINKTTIDLISTDDELAAVLGDSMLRQTLAWDLDAAKYQRNRALNKFGSDADDIADREVLRKALEVRQALPIVLENAGYTASSMIRIRERILNHCISNKLRCSRNNDPVTLRKEIEEIKQQPGSTKNMRAKKSSNKIISKLKAILAIEEAEFNARRAKLK